MFGQRQDLFFGPFLPLGSASQRWNLSGYRFGGFYAAITAMGCIADSEFHGARRLYEDVSIGRVPLWWWQVVNDILIY